jgi:hypothetical protein
MKTYFLFLICVLITSSNCKMYRNMDDELSFRMMNFSGNQLRIDGYYYNLSNSKIHNISFFFSNGITLNCGGSKNDFKEVEDYLSTQFLINKVHLKNKIGWGVFSIEGKSIKFERWYPSQRPYKAYVRSGEILNDTTFLITEMYRVVENNKTEVQSINEIYYFKQFFPKPDSSSSFIQ